MIDMVKLRRDGTSTIVTIPRQFMRYCDLLPTQVMVWEVLEDKTLRLRPIDDRSLSPRRLPKLVVDDKAQGI